MVAAFSCLDEKMSKNGTRSISSLLGQSIAILFFGQAITNGLLINSSTWLGRMTTSSLLGQATTTMT